jgi:hypothetical protein
MINRTNAFWVGVLSFNLFILLCCDVLCAAAGVQAPAELAVKNKKVDTRANSIDKSASGQSTITKNKAGTRSASLSKKKLSTNSNKPTSKAKNTAKPGVAKSKSGQISTQVANTRKNKQAQVKQARQENTRIQKAQAAQMGGDQKKTPYTPKDARKFARDLLYDAIELQKNLVSWDSLKVASMVFPLFVGTRMMDERLQYCFYDKQNHKNINCIPPVCHDLAQWSISIPIIILGSQMFWSPDDEMRETSRIFLIGLPFVIWTKTIIKKLRFEENLRPWNEAFDKENRCSGGFPSGHMAEAAYTALLYGMRFGPKFAIPLGSIAAFIGVSFVACNRHYLSQIVAGAGLGAVYALAANKLVDAKVAQNMKFGVKFENKSPAFSISYQF